MNTSIRAARRALPALHRGRALVICGPQGSGKAMLANLIAREYGMVAHVDGDALDESRSGSLLSCHLLNVPEVLIINGTPRKAVVMEALKQLITKDEVTVFTKPKPVPVKTPHVIFIHHSSNWALTHSDEHDRRFFVVQADDYTCAAAR